MGLSDNTELLGVNGLRIRWISQKEVVEQVHRLPASLALCCQPKVAELLGTTVGTTGKVEPESTETKKSSSTKPRDEDLIDLVVPKNCTTLGFSPSGYPPEQVLVKDVVPGSWAEGKKLLPGTEV